MQMQEELQGSSFCPELLLCSPFPDCSFTKHRKRWVQSQAFHLSGPLGSNTRRVFAACRASSGELDRREERQEWAASAGDEISKPPWDFHPQAGPYRKHSPCCAHRRGSGKGFSLQCPPVLHNQGTGAGPWPTGAAPRIGISQPLNIPCSTWCLEFQLFCFPDQYCFNV